VTLVMINAIWLSHGPDGVSNIGRPQLFSSSQSYLAFCVAVLAIVGYLATVLIRRNKRVVEPGIDRSLRDTWRMPPLDTLEPQNMTVSTRVWMAVLRGYLVIAVGLVIVKVVQMTLLK